MINLPLPEITEHDDKIYQSKMQLIELIGNLRIEHKFSRDEMLCILNDVLWSYIRYPEEKIRCEN